MIDTTRLRLVSLLAILAILCAANQVHALPPLGLTEIDTGFSRLEVIDGTAYISGQSGIQLVATDGNLSIISVSHPTLGAIVGVTRVVKGLDDELYVAANFSVNSEFVLGAALYSLSDPTSPIVTWEDARVNGVGANLIAYGNNGGGGELSQAARFLFDGSSEELAHPPGPGPNRTTLKSATPNGYASGDAGVPGTIGSAPAMWTPNGEFSFLDSYGFPATIRDRLDGNGVNAGWDGTSIKYGPGATIDIENEDGLEFGGLHVVVSHSDFAVVQNFAFPADPKYAFYPSINPNFPNRTMPLLDIFPELGTIDIDFISDLASVEGYLYMTLRGSDGTFLFGARDPSVIPEPTPALLLLTALPYFARRKS